MNSNSSLKTVWIVNAALLVGLAVWWLAIGRSNWTPPPALIPDYATALEGAAAPGSLRAQDYPTIAEAPLFEADRLWPKAIEPEVKPEKKEEPIPDALDGIVLQGIYDQIGAGVAIFSIQGKSHRLKVGETYEGWTLAEVDRLSVRFTSDTHGEKSLILKRKIAAENEAQSAETSAPPAASNPASSNSTPAQRAPIRRSAPVGHM